MVKNEKSPTFRDFLYVLYKYKKTLIIFVLASVLISVAYSYICYPKYEASGKILIEFSEQQSTPTMGNLGQRAPAMITTMPHSKIINSEIQLLRSRYIAEKVFAVLGERIMNPPVEEVKTTWQEIKQTLKETMGSVVDGINRVLYEIQIKEKLSPKENALLFIQKGLKVELIRNSNSVKVLFKSACPTLAADIVDEAICQYMSHRLTIHRPSTALQFMEEQTSYFKKKLDESEASLRSFKNQWQVASLDEQISHLLELNSDIKNDIYRNDTEIAALEGKINSLENSWSKAVPDGGQNRITRESGLIDLLKMKLTELKLKRIDLSTRYSDDNRLVMAADEEIAETEKMLKEEEVETDVSIDIDGLKSRKKKLNELLELSVADLNKLSGLDHQLRKLTRNVRLNEELYADYFNKTEEARIIEAMDLKLISNARLMESPFKPILPIRTISFIPQRMFNIMMAFFVGVFISVSLVMVMEMFDHSFRSAEDVEEYIDIPVLGTISEKRRFRNSLAIEYRKLGNNFCLLTKDQEPVRSVLVVGSVHREGASGVARNFAKAMAEAPGSKVLLMDMNYRSPSIASLKKRPKGVSDVFLEEAEPEDVIVSTETENLSLLPCGFAQCDPHIMVNSKRFAELLAKLQKQFDLVVIDSSPIQYYPESTLLASKVAGVLLVVCAESTRREIVFDARKKIEMAGGKILGAVLNRRKHYIPKLIYNRL